MLSVISMFYVQNKICKYANVQQQFYSLPENVDQVKFLNIGFVPALLLLIDIYSS